MDEKILELISKQSQVLDSMLEKTAASTMTANKLHGIDGLWNVPGLEREVIVASVRPHGVAAILPLLPSVIEDPRFGSITGIEGFAGARATTSCADAPAGYMKGCTLTARFGLTRFDTNTIEMDKVMLRANRGDFKDLQLYGNLLGDTKLTPGSLSSEGILDIVTKAEMLVAGVAAERQLSQDIWQGTVASGAGPGLDVQIATGHIDAETSTTCPSIDSDIKDFNYSAIDGTDRDIVEYLSMMMYYLEANAVGAGLDPVEFVVVMRPQLWYELSAVWPCRYMTNRCTNSAGTNVVSINDDSSVTMRDAMRRAMTIDINGKTYRVVTDTGIYEKTNITNAQLLPGQYASSIYILPLTISGGLRVTYREYLDYSQAQADIALLNNTQSFWTDGGIYTWAVEQVKWCYKLSLKTEQRIILRTPQLAGKLQNVKYTPLQHLREPYPASPYFVDGGVSLRDTSFGAAVWS